jgi:hypothetical protein
MELDNKTQVRTLMYLGTSDVCEDGYVNET